MWRREEGAFYPMSRQNPASLLWIAVASLMFSGKSTGGQQPPLWACP